MNPARVWQAARALGPAAVARAGWYRLGLRTGLLRRLTPLEPWPPQPLPAQPPAELPGLLTGPTPADLLALWGSGTAEALRQEADAIAAGQVRLFGEGPLQALDWSQPGPAQHWTEYERAQQHFLHGKDIKLTWEPGRFGWAFTLARAYRAFGDERYAEVFWRQAEAFWATNPPNAGPHWASAQEVALRLIALAFADWALRSARASTPPRRALLAAAAAAHARRIPPTLAYARAQANNHLLSETAGLITAGLLLPDHPQAAGWLRRGWQAFNQALRAQIRPDGAYTQHSTNYHRLMLHLALWVNALRPLPQSSCQSLGRAVAWLAGHMDPISGQMDNLGANDGALLFPLAPADGFLDARPTLQAAARAFTGQPALPPGAWDELSLWLGLPTKPQPLASFPPPGDRLICGDSWASLRAVRFTERPSHADQLHVALAWRGEPIALDPGTYLYNAPPPWDNPLPSAAVHNTITVDGAEPMTRAGRFLWLDWDQADWLEQGPTCLEAERSGCSRQGVRHLRRLEALAPGRWRITDRLLPAQPAASGPVDMRLHWLLPDWPWQLVGDTLRLAHPRRPGSGTRVTLRLEGADPQLHLVRAGELLRGDPRQAAPVAGWYSPTYAVKTPALAFIATAAHTLPAVWMTDIDLE